MKRRLLCVGVACILAAVFSSGAALAGPRTDPPRRCEGPCDQGPGGGSRKGLQDRSVAPDTAGRDRSILPTRLEQATQTPLWGLCESPGVASLQLSKIARGLLGPPRVVRQESVEQGSAASPSETQPTGIGAKPVTASSC